MKQQHIPRSFNHRSHGRRVLGVLVSALAVVGLIGLTLKPALPFTAAAGGPEALPGVVVVRSAAVARAAAVRVAPPSPPPTAPGSPPATNGFPSAATTGVPAGTVLQPSGSVTVNTAGTVLDRLDISGTVTINASDVVLRNSRVTGSDFALVRVKAGVTGVRIEDTEINGRGLSGTSNSMGVYGPATVVRANIYGVENGVAPFSNSTVRDSYIHDLGAPGSPHYDGIQIDGDLSNIVIQHNTVDVSNHDQTSAVMIDNYFGPTANVAVTGNRLLGGGYTVYSDGQFSGGTISGVSFTGNRLGRGYWGYSSIVANTPVWTGNVDDTTGAAVSAH